jgi:hypothetical protein
MFSCGYRSLLVLGYCAYCYVALGWRWQPAAGVLCGCLLAHLDFSWTRAMWPKERDEDAYREAWFQVGARAACLLGAAFAVAAVATDVAPAALPTWARLVFPGPYHAPAAACLAARGLT